MFGNSQEGRFCDENVIKCIRSPKFEEWYHKVLLLLKYTKCNILLKFCSSDADINVTPYYSFNHPIESLAWKIVWD